MVIIVFEGHDMVGKTNIAKAVGERLGTMVYKSSREKGKWWDPTIDLLYGMDAYIDMIRYFKQDIIFDRFHGSEYAYSQVFKRFTSKEKLRDIDTKLADTGCIIVYCWKTPPHYEPDDTGLIDMSQYDNIKDAYDEFLEFTNCDVVKICTDDKDLEKQVEEICSAVLRCKDEMIEVSQ